MRHVRKKGGSHPERWKTMVEKTGGIQGGRSLMGPGRERAKKAAIQVARERAVQDMAWEVE